MTQNIDFDPAIEATFHLSEQGITRVTLVQHKGTGLNWVTINEDKGNHQELKLLIDKWMTSYAQKQRSDVILPLASVTIPPFTRKVLHVLATIPFGEQVSYGELATLAGNPHGSRAVGGACCRNPWLLIVPCHRVLASRGELGGFSAGLGLKRQLLHHEGIMFKS